MYQKVYRCRVCGEKILFSMPTDRIYIDIELSQIITKKFEKLFCLHNCKNGHIGIAELQGVINKKNS